MSIGKDANDYSRFDKIQDDDEALTAEATSSLIETIAKAQHHKERGNQLFKENSLKLAKESYEDGLLLLDAYKSRTAIETLPNKAIQDDVRNLIVSFYSNLSMISIKEESWFRALTNATKAIELDSTNVKCLYRRAVANARLSQHEEAIADFNKVLNLDPSNSSAKKELADVLKAQKDQKKKETASFGKIFSNGSSLYDDREKERSDKIKRQEEQRLKQQDQWKVSNEHRLSQGLESQTFDDWKKGKEEEENKMKKEQAPSSSAPPKIKVPPKPKSAGTDEDSSNSNPDELYDEEEKRILEETKSKGYCYFKETAAKMEKRVFTPTAIDLNSPVSSGLDHTPFTPQTNHTPTQVAANGSIGTSSWNYAGTWEERDLTEISKQKIQEDCLSIKNIDVTPESSIANVAVRGSISSVDKLEGEAQIVMSRGKKRHLYDFNMKLDFEIFFCDVQSHDECPSTESKVSAGVKKCYKGSLTYADVTPQSTLECAIKWKKLPSGIYEAPAKEAVQTLHQKVQIMLRQFETEYCLK